MKVGDYVRYSSVYNNAIKIRKINAIIPPDNLIEENYYKFNDYEGTIEKDIIKSSPNIIDLIEEKDFIGNYCVEEIYDYEDGTRTIFLSNGFDEVDNEYILENGVVTHEQFSQMEYKVG